MKKVLYFVGTNESEAKNSWLAIASCESAAKEKMAEMSESHGATCVVAKEIDMTRRRRKGKK